MSEQNLGTNSVKTQSNRKSQNGESGKQFSQEKLVAALRNVEDMMDSIVTEFILLGETARQAVTHREIAGSRIIIGVKKAAITPEVLSTLKTIVPKDCVIADNGFTYTFEGVPVTVKFIRSNYKFFSNPDVAYFAWDTYKVPNPFDDYWNARFLIR